ncbi:hypothetical protein [Streptomyces platensis]
MTAWSVNDQMRLASLWEWAISDLDSDWQKYEYVSHIAILGG